MKYTNAEWAEYLTARDAARASAEAAAEIALAAIEPREANFPAAKAAAGIAIRALNRWVRRAGGSVVGDREVPHEI